MSGGRPSRRRHTNEHVGKKWCRPCLIVWLGLLGVFIQIAIAIGIVPVIADPDFDSDFDSDFDAPTLGLAALVGWCVCRLFLKHH